MSPITLPSYRPLTTYLPAVEEELMTRGDKPPLPLLTLPTFNRKIWGLKPGLTVIGARTSMGKTTFSLQLAYDLAKQGIPTIFLSLEMSVDELVERLFCNIKQVDNFAIITGALQKDATIREKWEEFKAELDTVPLVITEGLGFSFEEVNKLLEDQPTVKAIFVDYIQTIRQTGGREREMLNEYLRQFRTTCLQRKIAGVMCSQINRLALDGKTDRREPELEHLKGSGTIEEISDMIVLLHWDWFYLKDKSDVSKKNLYQVRVAKNRRGRTGSIKLKFIPEFYRFEDIPEQKEAEKNDVHQLFGETPSQPYP